MERIIFHVDVNSAFLSWEAVRRLRQGDGFDIRAVPSAIGGDQEERRGVILAKSVPAKEYGVVTGEPIVSAKRKCPHLLLAPADFKLYRECSKAFFAILTEYSDRVEAYSIDEAFLDYTGMEALLGPAEKIAFGIKERIKAELGFTVNVGVSSNKLLAKMAGELKKPDRMITLYPHEIEEKLWPLPVRELFMVGRQTEKKLNGMGIRMIGDLAQRSKKDLSRDFKSFGQVLYNHAHGIDDSEVAFTEHQSRAKSIGNSTTLPHDIKFREDAHLVLLSLSEEVAARLRKASLKSDTICVTIKTSSFVSYNHQCKLNHATSNTNLIYKTAAALFDQVYGEQPIRLLGLRADIAEEEEIMQLSLLDMEETVDNSKEKALDKLSDSLRNRFGQKAFQRASLLERHKG